MINESVFESVHSDLKSAVSVQSFIDKGITVEIIWNDFNAYLCDEVFTKKDVLQNISVAAGCKLIENVIYNEILSISSDNLRLEALQPSTLAKILLKAFVSMIIPLNIVSAMSIDNSADLWSEVYRYSIKKLTSINKEKENTSLSILIKPAGKAYSMLIPQIISYVYAYGELCKHPVILKVLSNSNNLQLSPKYCTSMVEAIEKIRISLSKIRQKEPDSITLLKMYIFDKLCRNIESQFPLDGVGHMEKACFDESIKILNTINKLLCNLDTISFTKLWPDNEHILNNIIGAHIVWSSISNMFLVIPSVSVEIYSDEQTHEEEKHREIDYIVLGWIPKHDTSSQAKISFEPIVMLIETTLGSDKKHGERVRKWEETICERLRQYQVDCKAILASPCFRDGYDKKDGKDEVSEYSAIKHICLEELMNPSTFSKAVIEVFMPSNS